MTAGPRDSARRRRRLACLVRQLAVEGLWLGAVVILFNLAL
jgi:hypothetical protein